MLLKIKRLGIVLGAVFILFAIGITFKARAADNSISINMTTQYGIDGHAKMGMHTPLKIVLNNISDSFNGHVQVIVSSLFFSSPYNSSSPAMLFADIYRQKNYMFEKQFCAKAGEDTEISLNIPLVNKKNQIKISIYDENNRLLKSYDEAVDAEEYYLSTYIGIFSDNQGIGNYFNNSDMYKYTDYSIKTINIDAQDIPFENYGLEIFDIIIVNEQKLNKLTEKQRNVIKNWQENGGILSVVTNEQESEAQSWEDFISADTLKNMTQLQYNKYWTISSAFSNIYVDSAPNIYFYLILLLIYIVLIGPALYFVLKKINKRGYFWLTELACSFLFMTIIIFIGKNTRFSAPFVSYYNIESYEDNSLSDKYYFNIQAPYNNEYRLFLDNTYSVVPIHDYLYNYETKKINDSEDYNVGITYKKTENMITVRNDSPFTKEYFAAEKLSANTSGNADVTMNLFMNELTGSVTNNFDFDLENAAIFTYNKAVFIGDIKAHETVSLDELKVYTYNPKFKDGIASKAVNMKLNSNGIIANKELPLNQKKGLLDLYLDERFGMHNSKGFLTGFKAETNNFDIQLDSGYRSFGATLVEVPFEINYNKAEMSYLSYIPINNESFVLSGEIMYSDEMIYTYKLGDSLDDISLYFTDINYYNDSYYKKFEGRIYLLNRKTKLYDPIDKEKRMVSAVDLEQYLSEDNEVIVKYAQELNSDSKETLIPSVSAIGKNVTDAHKEDSNARN